MIDTPRLRRALKRLAEGKTVKETAQELGFTTSYLYLICKQRGITYKRVGPGLTTLTPEQRREIARKGGRAVVESRGSDWMARIGRQGGTNVSQDRAWMSTIGAKGGAASRTK